MEPSANVFLSLAPSCGRSTERFRSFMEQHPDIAEEYLYTENASLHSGPSQRQPASPSPSSLNLQSTAKTANGICADFSPSDHDGTIDKKHK